MTPSEEEQWLERARNGEESAFKKLYDTHVEGLFRFLNQFSRNREEVKDWVQIAFIKGFEKLHTFHGSARFRTWLWSIALNEVRMTRRSAKPLVVEEEVPENGRAVSDISKEELMTMQNQIAQLDEQKRMVLLLYEVEGYSHREIAFMLEVGESSSRTILSRTKKELRNKIGTEI